MWLGERRLLPQDRPLELLQRRAGLDAELLDEQRPAVAVTRERLGLAAAAVERDHELAARPLAQGLFLDERLELGDEPGVLSQLEVGVDPLLQRIEPQLGKPAACRLCERLFAELGQRRTAPEVERLPQEHGLPRGLARGARLIGQLLEAAEVRLVRGGASQVAGRARLDRVGPERLPQLGDVDLHDLVRARGRLAPEVVHERVHGDDAAGLEQQPREQRARLAARELRRRLHRPEQPKADHDAAMSELAAPGEVVGGYRLEEPLGEGAVGLVFAARDAGGRRVALKLLRSELADDNVKKRE